MAKQTATDDLIALVAKALSERYPNDKGGKPGLLIAHLPDGGGPAVRRTQGGDAVYGFSLVSDLASRMFIGDPVSVVPAAPCWYVAAQRFMGPGKGEGRTNVDRETGDDLDAVIATLGKRLATGVDAQADLNAAVAK